MGGNFDSFINTFLTNFERTKAEKIEAVCAPNYKVHVHIILIKYVEKNIESWPLLLQVQKVVLVVACH